MAATAIGRIVFVLLASVFVISLASGKPAQAACTDSCKTTAGETPLNLKKFSKKTRTAHNGQRHRPHGIARRRPLEPDATDLAKVDLRSVPIKVADARAEMTSPDAGTAASADKPPAATIADSYNSSPAAENGASDAAENNIQLVNADELNDLDRAADSKSRLSLPPSVANARAEMRDDQSSAWAQTSSIGKAFIVFGVMLTFASAARMFMA